MTLPYDYMRVEEEQSSTIELHIENCGFYALLERCVGGTH